MMIKLVSTEVSGSPIFLCSLGSNSSCCFSMA